MAETLTSESAKILALKNSLFNEGPSPEYHRIQIRKFKSECPVVYKAMIALIGEEPWWAKQW